MQRMTIPSTPPYSVGPYQKPNGWDEFIQKHISGHYGFTNVPSLTVLVTGNAALGIGRSFYTHEFLISFREFVSYFLFELVTREFFDNQRNLEMGDRHPLSIWDALLSRNAGGQNSESGESIAWAMLAYQLYILEEHSSIPPDLLQRLRDSKQFQGARYEIQVAAMMICTGHKIDWLKPDGSGKHVEFIATHSNTGQRFAVEAKSRHREGVLAKGSESVSSVPLRVDFSHLISRALAKNPIDPLLIFIDANVPHGVEEMQPTLEREIDAAWKRVDRKSWSEKGFPCVGMIVTNDSSPWRVGKELKSEGLPCWAKFCTDDHRHELDAVPYLDEILSSLSTIVRIPDLNWKNSKRP